MVKTTSGDQELRPDAARVELECADGTEESTEIAPGEAEGSLERRSFNAATTCTVTEPADGAAAAHAHSHSHTHPDPVAHHPSPPPTPTPASFRTPVRPPAPCCRRRPSPARWPSRAWCS